jgi:hypothetical protein
LRKAPSNLLSFRYGEARLRGMHFRHGPGGGDVPDEAQLRRMNRPDHELPVSVPLNAVLARTEQVAIALVGAQVFTTGVLLELALRCRASALPERGRLTELLFTRGNGTPDLLLGLELADGRRLSNAEEFRGVPAADEAFFHPAGGNGGPLAMDETWWLSPVPPAGPLRIVVRCDPMGIAETTTVLDGALLADAAAGVVELWPWEPPPEMRPPREPDIPPGSWFAEE